MNVLNQVYNAVMLGDYEVRGQNIITPCPKCGKADDHFAFRADRKVYNCYSCGFKGRVRLDEWDFPRWRRLARMVGDAVDALPAGPQGGISLGLWTVGGDQRSLGPEDTPEPYPSLIGRVVDYCLSRGMTYNQIRDYRVSAIDCDARAYFPYWDHRGEISFYMGRAIDPDAKPKTLEPPATVATKPLFGPHVRRSTYRGKMVTLVEGVFDHFATPDSACVFGSALNNNQINDLADLRPSWVPVMFDPDAMAKARIIVKKLWVRGIPAAPVDISEYGYKEDPASLGLPVMNEIITALERGGIPRSPACISVYPVASRDSGDPSGA